MRTLTSVVICGTALLGCGTDSTRPLVATHVAFDAQPSASLASGQSLGTVRVTVLSADDRIVTGTDYQVSVSLLTSDPSAQITGTTSVQTNTGVATFTDLAVARAGSGFQLVAQVSGLTDAISQPFSVTAGPAAQLRFDAVGNSGTTVGSSIPPVVVRVTDAGGNLVADATNQVTIGYNRTGSMGFTVAPDGIFGTTTVAAVNGVATFSDITFHKSGGYILTAQAPGLNSATSGGFTMFSGAMTRLIFVTQPPNGTTGSPLAPFSVQLVDDYGNGISIPPGGSYSFTISMGSNPTGATLSGTLTKQGFGAVATSFDNVSLDKSGTGYTLIATMGNLTVTSAPFDIQ